MAEFSEVMRQWKRMCNYYTERADDDQDACAICKFEGDGSNCLAVYEDSEPDTAEVERVVMSWAAEHPEPVYPSWYAWLANMNVVPIELPPDEAILATDIGLLKKIPADIAQKLGIQPKEG